MCEAAGTGIELVRLKLGAPEWKTARWSGPAATRFGRNIPSPHGHYLCWRTGTMERWECAAFAD